MCLCACDHMHWTNIVLEPQKLQRFVGKPIIKSPHNVTSLINLLMAPNGKQIWESLYRQWPERKEQQLITVQAQVLELNPSLDTWFVMTCFADKSLLSACVPSIPLTLRSHTY